VSPRRIVVDGGRPAWRIGHYLAEHARDFLILQAASEPAVAWRQRRDSLVLFTPTRRGRLPGKPFPGARNRYRTRRGLAATPDRRLQPRRRCQADTRGRRRTDITNDAVSEPRQPGAGDPRATALA
jgi:cation diffusion facilitator CzcD-associated flavoprotein CzcO